MLCCPPDVPVLSPAVSMQSPEAGSDSAAPVALHPSAPAQAPVVQAVPASQQVKCAQLGCPHGQQPCSPATRFNPGFKPGFDPGGEGF